MGLLHRLKKLSSYHEKVNYSLVHPYINYRIQSWHVAFQSAKNEVHVLQKKVLRAVFILSFKAHSKLNELYKFNLCCHLYKILQNENNHYFAKYFRSYQELHSYNTRNNSSLIFPKFNLATSQNSFAFQSIKNWNCLLSTIRKRSNFRLFNFH